MLVSLGYLPEVPDRRDLVFPAMGSAAAKLAARLFPANSPHRPSHLLDNVPPPGDGVNLLAKVKGQWPVEDQGQMNSCTAHAVIGVLEYLSRVQAHQPLDLSRLFLYDNARRLLGWTGDTGAYVRSTIKAAVTFGVPPEEAWPYNPDWLDSEPRRLHLRICCLIRQ